MKARIYHNEKCSKSNAAFNLLLEHGFEVEAVNYLETPLSVDEIGVLLKQLGIMAVSLIRFGEPLAAELELSKSDDRNEDAWALILSKHPILIERPVVVIDGRAVIGRPLESVLAFIQSLK